jgi:outer membrane immunogenic protein
MKKLRLCVALISLSAAGTVMAADLPVKAPVAPAVVYETWSGFYIGAHAGFGWAEFGFRDPFIESNAPIAGFPGLFVGVPLERHFHGNSFLGGFQSVELPSASFALLQKFQTRVPLSLLGRADEVTE